MDPISLLVAAWVVVLLVGKAPEVIAEIGHAWRGEVSPRREARMKRLADAGIDPATGGAARQYFGNLWRDMWLDLDQERAADRASRRPYTPDPDRRGWRQRFRDRRDSAAEEHIGRWRGGDTDAGPKVGDTGEPDVVDAEVVPDQSEPEPVHTPQADATDAPDQQQTPIFADATVGDPIPDSQPTRQQADPQQNPQVIEGEVMSTDLARGGAVTGVVSGAAEARAIQRALDVANEEYVRALIRLRARMHALGEQTLSVVQFSGRSSVVQILAQAAEAAAAAQAAAKACGAEVGPLMGQVARAFDARNS